jgi:phosphoglycerol transferase
MITPTNVADNTGLRRFLPAFALLIAMIGIYAWLKARSHGLNPTIFADEWYYSKMSRLQDFSEAIVPSYLYLWLFRGTNACGDGFLECVRGANTLLFVGAAPFVYLCARTVAGRAVAFVVALLATLAPLNLFTAYFMPEATYYFGFWVLSWIALTRRGWHWAVQALATGAVLGLMSQVKVHALFLIPALCLYLVYARWVEGGAWLRKGFLSMALAAGTVLAFKFGLGWLLAGEAGLSLFGPFYTEAANVTNQHSRLDLIAPGFINLRGHLMVLAAAFGLPLALLLQALLRPSPRAAAGPADLLRAWALLMLGAAAGMTVLYTSTLGRADSHEALRLHLRYYSFVFPLLWIAAAAALGRDGLRGRDAPALLRWILALLLGAVVAIGCVKLPTYAGSLTDGPEAVAIALDQINGRLIAGVGVAALLLWAARAGAGTRAGASLFLYVAAPAFIANGIVANGAFLPHFSVDQEADAAGKAARRLVPAAERGSITVAGTGAPLMRAQFHIDHKDTVLLDLPDNTPIASYQLPVHNKWLLVFGRHPLPPVVHPVAATNEYALVRLDNHFKLLGRANLAKPYGEGLIAGAEGLSYSEPLGRWSDAKRVVLHLNTVLPRRLHLVLRASAYGDNAELPFILRVGGASEPFRVGAAQREIGIRLDTDGAQRDIVIEVPHPVSPAEAANQADTRKLGIALAEIEISTPGD